MSREQEYMLLAEQTAQQSPDKHMKVGCVGVNSQRKGIVSFGYNSMPDKENHPIWKDRDARRPLVVHAETMMCAKVSQGSFDEVFITLFPCVHCLTQLAQMRVQRIVYKDIYDKDLPALEVARFYGIKCEKLSTIKDEEI